MTAPATCPIWCVRKHSPRFPAVHASDTTSITEAMLVNNIKEQTTEVSLLQLGDKPPVIRLHTYARGHQYGKRPGGCCASHIDLRDANGRAEVWRRGGSSKVAAAIQTLAGLVA